MVLKRCGYEPYLHIPVLDILGKITIPYISMLDTYFSTCICTCSLRVSLRALTSFLVAINRQLKTVYALRLIDGVFSPTPKLQTNKGFQNQLSNISSGG